MGDRRTLLTLGAVALIISGIVLALVLGNRRSREAAVLKGLESNDQAAVIAAIERCAEMRLQSAVRPLAEVIRKEYLTGTRIVFDTALEVVDQEES